ncbi:MAG: PAS domain S-box protein [Burkholderiaceae bacterium]
MSHPSLAAPASALLSDACERTVFRSLFLAYPDSMLLVDQAGFIVMANPSAELLLGYPPDQLIGLNVDTLVPEGIRPRHAAHRETYARAPRARPMGTQTELVAKRRDGSEVRVEIALIPLQDHGLPLVVAAIRDIGAYLRVKQALQRARYSEHLAQLGRVAIDARNPQAVLDQVPAIAAAALEVDVARVFLLDGDRAALRVASGVGAVAGEEIGSRIPYLPDTSPGLVLSLGQPLIVPDYRVEQRFVVPQAYLDAGLISALAVPVSDRGQTIGALAVRSREAKKFGDDELQFFEAMASLLATSLQRAQSEEALNHAQRLESVGQLTGGIAHDFNNLLTVIQGNLQVLDELAPDADDAYRKQLVAAATRASRRGAELTAKLLAFSRRQVLQPVHVDLDAMLHSLADMLRRTLGQRIRIEVDIAPACPPVLADPSHLESALLNIAINARDAMSEGGTLRFRVALCGVLPREVRTELEDTSVAEDSFVSIAISDTGSGMPDEVKERAFEPFFTTKEVGRGTGLGLSTVYGFIKQSKGAITIDSAPGAGSTLTLYIPRPREAPATGTVSASATHAVSPGLEVLLVEDDAEVRSVVHTFLDALGCKVSAVSSAEHALLALDPNSAFDLLLTDITLGPGMRGTELATYAQERFPSLPVLLMSGFPAELLEADRESPSSWELLRKPYSREELARAIGRVLAANQRIGC